MIPIAALIPLVPLIVKAFDAKKEGKKNKKKVLETIIDTAKASKGFTEVGQVGYVATLFGIYQAVISCSDVVTIASILCISSDQWVALGAFLSMVYLRLRDKAKS